MLHEEGHLPLLRCTLLMNAEQGKLVQPVGASSTKSGRRTHAPVMKAKLEVYRKAPPYKKISPNKNTTKGINEVAIELNPRKANLRKSLN